MFGRCLEGVWRVSKASPNVQFVCVGQLDVSVEQVKTVQVRTGQVRTGQVGTRHIKSRQVASGHAQY